MNAQNVDPTRLLERTSLILAQIIKQNRPITGTTFLEVGTGWKLTTPMALWLCGADRVITVDLNPYLRPDLVQLEADYVCQNRKSVAGILSEVADADCLNERFDQLQSQEYSTAQELMQLMNIEYLSPADAASLPNVETIDYHISHTVFEHIPHAILLNILQEAHHLLSGDGLCIHFVDPSDHFSHRDTRISEINFLQFSESQWNFWANNRYAYHNRLRVDDYENLFIEAGFQVVDKVIRQDTESLAAIKAGFQLREPFVDKSPETNASTKLLITAQKQIK